MATVIEGVTTSSHSDIGVNTTIDASDPGDDSFPGDTIVAGVEPLMSISTGLIALIRQVRGLESTVISANFTSLERKLLQWKHDDGFRTADDNILVTLDLVALAKAYRLCGLILVYRKINREHPMLYPLATRTLSALQRIPEGSAAEAGFNLPLFLAGAELREEGDVEACMRRLKSTHAKYRFDNISRVEVVLEHVWRPMLNCQPRRHWDSVLQEKRWSLSLS